MKKTVREVALETLLVIEKGQAFSNIAVNAALEKNLVNGKDIPLFTELVYGTLQRKMTLHYLLTPFIKGKKIDDWVLWLLSLSIYQLEFLDRIPEHAILNEAVEIAKKKGHKGTSGFVNGVLRSYLRSEKVSFESIKNVEERLSLQYSYPLWLVKEWIEHFGEKVTEEICQSMLIPPTKDGRVNETTISKEQAIQALEEEGYTVEEGKLAPVCITISSGNLAHTALYQEGGISIQDESSMLVGYAVNPKENDTVLDCCAAPGGKTSHIAEKLNGKGKVVAVDLHQHKVKLIDKQTKRLHLNNVETTASDARLLSAEFEEESFDVILVDAPCSGLGVIRRKPEIKYTKTKEDCQKLAKISYDILESVAPLLKKGGKLVFSTCTIEYEENMGNINRFLANHPEFSLDLSLKDDMPKTIREESYIDGALQILPSQYETDGFFIARLDRKVTS